MARRNITKRLIIGIIIVLGIAVSSFAWWRTRSRAAVDYATTAVERGSLRSTVTATGTLEAVRTVQVVNNENKSLRNRDLVGITMLDGFRYAAASKKYTGGTVYLFPAGKTMTNQELSVSSNQLRIKVKFGIMSKTLTLTRA
jgi:hypothetical protein